MSDTEIPTKAEAPHSEQERSFFVYIVESPSAPDLYHRRSEGGILEQTLRLSGTTCVSRLAISKGAFEAALKIGLAEEMRDMPALIPILHISAHGFTDGISLSNGDVMSWEDLKDLLIAVNRAFNGYLVVCMSSCEGYAGIRMAMDTDGDLPFIALVGCAASPTWSETSVAYATFYHLLARGATLNEAVSAMRVASGNNRFYCETGKELREGYLEYLARQQPAEIREELEAEAERETPSDLAKMRALESPEEGRST